MGVQEEALIEELLYLIGHLAHAEQHLLEIDSGLKEPINAHTIDRLRMARKEVGRVLFDVIGARGEGGGEFRTGSESYWCAIKHLTMALIHCDECIEKVVRRLVQNSSQDALEKLRVLLATRDEIRGRLKEIIEKSQIVDLKDIEAIRCREDLCLEG